MEIGDYGTNVICTYELNLIAYSYYECSSETTPVSPLVYRLVADLQQLGFLAVKDNKKSAIWIFETGGSSETIPPPLGAAQKLSGLASILGVELTLKISGSYDSNALLESWKSLSKPPTDSGESISQKEFFEKHFRAAQAAREASANNDNGAPNPALKDRVQQIQLIAQARMRLQIHDYFLTAVFSSLGYSLCVDYGYIPLSSRTLVVPEPNHTTAGLQRTGERNNEPVDKRLQFVTLSSDYTRSKVLVIKASLSKSTCYTGCNLPRHVKAEDVSIPTNSVLILGPGGATGNFKGLTNHEFQPPASTYAADAEEGQHPGNQGQFYISHRLRSRCLDWLVTKGVNKDRLENCAWFMVEVYLSHLIHESRLPNSMAQASAAEEPMLIPWPSFLCFRQISNNPDASDAFGTLSTYDPLEFAQTWFAGQHDRDATIHRRKKEREASEAVHKTQVESETQDLHSLYSPLALRRSSMAGLVYPTPPDAVQHTVGATPTFEEVVSTPGQPGQPPPANANSLLLAKIEADKNGAVEVANNQSSDFDFHDTSNGNLFGDVGDDLFGEENDVTDADFSFFDEPDVFEGGQNNDVPSQDNAAEVVEVQLTQSPKEDLNISNENEIIDIRMGNTDETPVEEKPPIEQPSNGNSLDQPEKQTETCLVPPQTVKQEPSPPLKPEFVFGQLSSFDVFSTPLLAKRHDDSTEIEMNPVGAFGGVDFKALFSSLHPKYGTHGRFIYPSHKASPNTSRAKLPTTGYFARRRRRHKMAGKSSMLQGLAKNTDQLFLVPAQATDLEKPAQHGSRSPTPQSDQDDSSDEMYGSPTHIDSNLKRKRNVEDISEGNEDDDIASSFQELQVGKIDETDNEVMNTIYPFALDTDLTRWSAAMLLMWPDPWINGHALTDMEYIAAAQILGDQAISYTLRYPDDCNGNKHGVSLEDNIKTAYTPDLIRQDVLRATTKYFKGANPCTLSAFLDIQGIPRQLAGLNRLPPRPITGSQGVQSPIPAKPNPLFQLPSPHLELRRSDSKLSVLASALPFWDVLGLAPRGNGKHVTSLCVFPNAAGMSENADIFLENIRSAYETRRLGSHERLNAEGCVNGLLSIELGGQAARFASDQGLSVIREALFQVATTLAASKSNCTNFVVYIVYDPESPEILVPICSAFHSMFEAYKTALSDKTVSNELVLQLVPLDFIGSRTHLVVLPPTDYARLAMEVYDRCFDFQSGVASPSVAIEPPLPRTIEFKLSTQPSASVLQENSCLQIAYAQSIDDRWVTAAWSDNTGSEQMTASYCLGKQDGPLTRQFSDIANEIWETTLDIISSKKIQWRIIIAKCGVMEPQDVRFWKGLSETEKNAQISLTLISVDTQPALQLLAPDLSVPASTLSTQSTFYTTPVSTPQPPSILSPDQSGSTPTATATPSDVVSELKIEPDATLIDLTNQSYGAVLAHRVNNSNSPLEVRPTAISGYLIKRTGASSSDIPAVMEVNIVWTDINPRLTENPLKEILAWYSGLATLARARGIVDPVKDTRPWHIAAAEKAVRLLYLLM